MIFQRIALCLALLTAGSVAHADEACRVAFDLGSSGIRAGSTTTATSARASINYLDPLWAGRGLDETLPPTLAALRELPAQAGFPAACARVGGGFSAWRLALAQDPGQLATHLARIREETGVAVLVIPQIQEGNYGYRGARQLMGNRLQTSHILDIGGGSLQVAGERHSYGALLGQKAWRRQLCQTIREQDSSTCTLQPLNRLELATARRLARDALHDIRPALPIGQLTMTAISRPVTRGVLPALTRLYPAEAASHRVRLPVLTGAIHDLAGLSLDDTARLTGQPAAYAGDLFPTLLLVEGLLQMTETPDLQVAEIDLTNLPALLADDRAFRWAGDYDCYLARLRALGIDAYASDPASCPANAPRH